MLCLMRAVSNTAEMLSSWRVTEEEDGGIKKAALQPTLLQMN